MIPPIEFETQRLFLRQWRASDREPFAALNEIKATGEFIGCVGLNIPREDLPVSPCVEILWRLARAYWRQGFATEAARGALRIGFEVLNLPEIVAFTVPTNTRSRAVMQRLGMQMDAATFEHPGVPEGHALRTHCNYRLSRSGWFERNRNLSP